MLLPEIKNFSSFIDNSLWIGIKKVVGMNLSGWASVEPQFRIILNEHEFQIELAEFWNMND